ncbi:MAG: hypothetical protein U0M06_00790 [Clostridia bacterium]|nr:hypothetical protein [Clostridia bacterium]
MTGHFSAPEADAARHWRSRVVTRLLRSSLYHRIQGLFVFCTVLEFFRSRRCGK